MARQLKCIVVDDDLMTRRIVEGLVDRTDGLDRVGSFSDAIAASNFLSSEHVDLIFLDVEMPEMTGLEFLASLSRRPSIVLISSQEKYAAPAFDLDVTDFIVKPIDYPRFLKSVNRVKEQEEHVELAKDTIPGRLFVKVDNHLLGLEIAQIMLVEAMADYVRIYTPEKRYTVYSSMKGISAKLPDVEFMRVHRSYIVNLNKIDQIEDNTLSVAGNVVPVGVTYQKEMMARLNIL
jgi:DNA-binding LytR/AlgR family response regulator